MLNIFYSKFGVFRVREALCRAGRTRRVTVQVALYYEFAAHRYKNDII